MALSQALAADQPVRIGTSLSLTGKQYSLQGGYCRFSGSCSNGRRLARRCRSKTVHAMVAIEGKTDIQ
jgi:hypothetical protein